MSAPFKVEVAVDQPLQKTFTYLVPEKMVSGAVAGMRVLVPFGRRKVTGYILGTADEGGPTELKEIEAFLDDKPVFSVRMLAFFRWVSSYYMVPIGEVIKTALPAGINMASYKSLSLTEEGKARAAEFEDDEGKILSFLLENNDVALSRFKNRFSGGKGLSCLYRLENRGYVRIDTKIRDGRIRIKMQKFVKASLPSREILENLSSRGKEIVNDLLKGGERPLSRLIEEMGTTLATLRRLEKLGALRIIEEEVFRDPFHSPVKRIVAPLLSENQKSVMKEIDDAMKSGSFRPFLLEGKTGSGKTEIYIRTIEKTGGKAIVLIPEISLTPQLTRRFRERFDDRIAVLHSGLSPGERFDQWRRIRNGDYDIVIGARSAIFAPVDGLRVIVVDEEHESSYKQEDGIRYNARDLALVRGKQEGCLVLLGSATPSLESIKNVADGKLARLRLPERFNRMPLPLIQIVDMRKENKKFWISSRLKDQIEENLDKGEQTLLFLNRRGYAPFVLCQDCGHNFRCPNCSISLTWHHENDRLLCHYCDYNMSARTICPNCEGADLRGLGTGTEKVEAEIRGLFQHARIARMDRDTAKNSRRFERLLDAFERREFDILIGTQMVAKGHHFPGVTLVGVILADLSLNIPDFRAAERTYQLLTQVAGRAGREGKTGRVVIQTFNPDHYSILHGGEEDANVFYDRELSIRADLSYPPYTRLVNFKIEGRNECRVISCAERLKRMGVRIMKSGRRDKLEILGPAPAPIARLRGKSRWQMLVRSSDPTVLHCFAKDLLHSIKNDERLYSDVRIVHDVDPYSLI